MSDLVRAWTVVNDGLIAVGRYRNPTAPFLAGGFEKL